MKELVTKHLEKLQNLAVFRELTAEELALEITQYNQQAKIFGNFDVALINRKNFYMFKRLHFCPELPDKIKFSIKDYDYTVFDNKEELNSSHFDEDNIEISLDINRIKSIKMTYDIIVIEHATCTALINFSRTQATFGGRLFKITVGKETVWYVEDINSRKEHLLLQYSIPKRIKQEGRLVNFDMILHPLYKEPIARIRF